MHSVFGKEKKGCYIFFVEVLKRFWKAWNLISKSARIHSECAVAFVHKKLEQSGTVKVANKTTEIFSTEYTFVKQISHSCGTLMSLPLGHHRLLYQIDFF